MNYFFVSLAYWFGKVASMIGLKIILIINGYCEIKHLFNLLFILLPPYHLICFNKWEE